MSKHPTTASTRLADFDGSRDNNFNLIRFLAAVAVLFSHSYLLASGDEYLDPVFRATGWTAGMHAVDIFFVTSGFLIMSSLVRNPSPVHFIKARVLRIYPALIVAVLFCAFVVGPLFTKLALMDYLSNGQVYWFALANAMLEPFPIQYTLPGVFGGQPYPNDVNGSLWTLPHEIKAYVGTGLLFFTLMLLPKRDKLFPLAFFAATALVIAYYGYRIWQADGLAHDYVRLYVFFMVGGCFFILRERIVLSIALAGLLFVAAVACFLLLKNNIAWNMAWLILLPYVLFCLAYLPAGPLRRFNALGDYSYGIYIYAFPVQQMVVALRPGVSPIQMSLAALPVVLVIAVLSWHFIEKPSLKKIRGMRSKNAASS